MRTFTKNGETRTASTPSDAVRLKFDGWQETVSGEQPQQAAPTPAAVKRTAKPRAARKPRSIPTK